jgi:hypothetical protein
MSDLRRKLLEAKIASFERTGKTSALSGAIDDAELTSEAGMLADLWNSFFLLTIPKEERTLRVHMIGYAKEALSDLRKIELQILNKDLQGAILAYQAFANNFLGSFVSDYLALKGMEEVRLNQRQLPSPKPPAAAPEAPEAPYEGIPPSGKGQTVYDEAPPPASEPFDLAKAKKDLSNILTAIEVQKNALRSANPESAVEIEKRYNNLDKRIRHLKSKDVADKALGDLNVLKSMIADEMAKLKQKTSYLIDDDIRKVAQNAIQRWIKRKLMNMSPLMRERIYYKIIEDILSIHPLLKNINEKLKNRKVYMKDFDKEVRDIVGKMHTVNNRLLTLTQNVRSSEQKPTIRKEVLTNLKDLNKELEGAFEQEEG